jgi:hypothetical protein
MSEYRTGRRAARHSHASGTKNLKLDGIFISISCLWTLRVVLCCFYDRKNFQWNFALRRKSCVSISKEPRLTLVRLVVLDGLAFPLVKLNDSDSLLGLFDNAFVIRPWLELDWNKIEF